MKEIRLILLALLIPSISQIYAQNALCLRADSLLAEFKYSEAISEYMNIFEKNKNNMKSATAMNAAIAAAQCDMDSLAVELVTYALDSDSTFYDERISVTELLEDCSLLPQWDALRDESERRLANARPEYDIPLRNTLLEIYHSDQNPRGRVMMLYNSDPNNKEAMGLLWQEIHRNDSINLCKTIELLDTYG